MWFAHTHTNTHYHLGVPIKDDIKQITVVLFVVVVVVVFDPSPRDSYRIFCLGAGNDTCANETLMSMYGASYLTL